MLNACVSIEICGDHVNWLAVGAFVAFAEGSQALWSERVDASCADGGGDVREKNIEGHVHCVQDLPTLGKAPLDSVGEVARSCGNAASAVV